jgi:hypothetical protein
MVREFLTRVTLAELIGGVKLPSDLHVCEVQR